MTTEYRFVESLAREILDEDVLEDDVQDAIRSDDDLVHLATALHNVRMAEKPRGECINNQGRSTLRSAENSLEVLVEARLCHVIDPFVEVSR